MLKVKIKRFFCDILIAVLLFLFTLSLLWFINGSLEMVPTVEQQDKARLGAIISMIITGVPCLIFTVVRVRGKEAA